MAATSVLVVLLAAVLVVDRDSLGQTLSALPGATAEPTGPTGGPGGDGGFNGGQFQPPGMPSPPGGYNGGSYPAPGQSDYGVDINSPAAQAPEYSQAPQYPQQSYPQRQQPANGSQPRDYDRPIQSPAVQPTTQAVEQPTTAVTQQPSATSTPEPSQQQDTEQDSRSSRQQQCDDLPASVSVSSVSGVSQDAVNAAASSWSATGNPVSTASGGTGMPVKVIGNSDPHQDGKASFTPGSAGQPAEIRINLAHAGSPDELRALLTHELGHAFGLPDSVDPAGGDSLMALTAGTPQASDLAALSQARTTCTHGSGETENAPDSPGEVLERAFRKGSWDGIPLRRGWWNETTPDEGFGLDKAGYKHNLRDRSVIIDVIENARTALPASNPDYVLYQKEFSPTVNDPLTGEPLSFPGVTVSVVIDERTNTSVTDPAIPAGQAVGLITAYCNGMPKCPDWINTLPALPAS